MRRQLKGIKISNGTGSKQINVALNGEESKTYPVELAVSGSIEYIKRLQCQRKHSETNRNTCTNEEPAVTPVPTKKPTATRKAGSDKNSGS
ncbi:MAG: hypothetical protein ACLTJ5_09135 [Clostridium sp.]